MKRCLPAIGLFLCAVTALAAGGRPWKARWNQEVETFHITAHRNTPLSLWPAEPASPPEVTEDSFARALGMLCRSTSDERIKRYTAWILEDSAAFQVDPFLLAEQYIQEYQRHLDDLNVLPASINPRATREIDRIIAMISGPR